MRRAPDYLLVLAVSPVPVLLAMLAARTVGVWL